MNFGGKRVSGDNKWLIERSHRRYHWWATSAGNRNLRLGIEHGH
jgi:hypothetical protein